MDATPASGNGFDEALKALEDLETSVVQPREAKPATPPAPAPVAEPLGAIGFSDVETDGLPATITAVPFEEIETVVAALAPEPVAAPASTAAPAEVAPAPAPATVSPAAGRLGKAALGLALVSSIISAAGLIVAERTIMSAQLVVADAREKQQQLEKANKLIQDLEVIRDKQIELLQAQQAQLAKSPVTSEELQHRMETLQAGMAAHDPLGQVVQAIQAGQTETNARFSEFGMKMERVEAMLDHH